MANQILRIATRKSPLALWQANFIGQLITQHWPQVTIELVPMVTSGDRFLDNKLQQLGGKGLFVKELEEALLANRADLAVHSMKDVPTSLPEGLTLTAICKRENPQDAFVSLRYAQFTSLPTGSIVGTTSLRRQAQLLVARPDLIIKALRGNVNTRLQKLANQEFDAIILAVAGLTRLGLDNYITEQLTLDDMLPACGQGALGIECRADDSELIQMLQPLNDDSSALCVMTERHVNQLLGGNCHVPLAVYCTHNNDTLCLQARVLTPDGSTCLDYNQSGSVTQALQLAQQCAQHLLTQGAADLLSRHYD